LFDLIEVALVNPDLIYGMFQDLIRDFEQGSLKPLPLTEFTIEQSVVAFRYMAQAKHLGKVVITLPELIATENISALTEIRPDASYLITGGLGALGLQVAQWLALKGAKNLVLTGRSKPNNTAQNLIRELQQDGVDVLVTSCDLTDETEVIQLFQQITTIPNYQNIK
jgi:myxalamid-type polyketide synthase MxaB